jgi:hypothetical protein
MAVLQIARDLETSPQNRLSDESAPSIGSAEKPLENTQDSSTIVFSRGYRVSRRTLKGDDGTTGRAAI